MVRVNSFIDSRFFVNAPINIVSIPPVQATVGIDYDDNVMTSDMNQGALIVL